MAGKKRSTLSLKVDSVRPATPASEKTEKKTGARKDLKLLGAHVPLATVVNFGVIAAKLHMTHQDLMLEALDDLFAKHKDLLK